VQNRDPESNVAKRTHRSFSPWQRTIITCVAIVTVGATATAIASAAIPNGSTFNACYNKTSGALRLIDKSKAQKCKATESPTSWSKTGPRGATGATGGVGPSGPSHGALLYRKSVRFIGPLANQTATFTVPAGLMCAIGYATAFTATQTVAPMQLSVSFLAIQGPTEPYPDARDEVFTNEANSHRALIPEFGAECKSTGAADTVTYKINLLSPTLSDSSDLASLTIEVYSP